MNPKTPEENPKQEYPIISSVGNSWIICRSKTYSGRIYYFNTLTGEAAWNLSESEMEKAKNTTKMYQSQSGANLDGCPEPKEPPVNCQNGSYKSIPFKKKVIPNQFPNQPYVFGVVPSTSFNRNIWTVPSNHQILLPLPNSLNINQMNSLLDNCSIEDRGHITTFQNSTIPLSTKFNVTHNLHRNNRSTFVSNFNRGRNRNQNNSFSQRSGISNPNPSDLRQILSAKRNFGTNRSNHNNNPDGVVPKIQIIKPVQSSFTDVDDSWIKEHSILEGAQLKLITTPLKDIVVSDTNIGCWYIVADFEVIIDHFNLINVIVNSDDECHLMIPEEVMTLLQTTSRSNDTTLLSRAHLVLRLLSQQFTTGRVVLGKETSEEISENIYKFSLKLYEEYRNVVLISDNISIKNCGTDDDTLCVFTVQEIKELLTRPLKSIRPESNINIQISNYKMNSSNSNCMVSKEVQCELLLTCNASKILTINKKTSDMAVQTDIICELNTEAKALRDDCIGENKKTSNLSKTSGVRVINTVSLNNNSITVTDSDNLAQKKREIRLNRNQSQLPSKSNEINGEKKQFKWHRRKIDMTAMDSNLPETNDVTDLGCNRNIQCDKSIPTNANCAFDGFLNKSDNSRGSYEDNNDESTSSYCVLNRVANENITVNETSTSEIISNTGSNTENICDNIDQIKNNKALENREEDEIKCTCVMFEVESPSMKELLKTRSDEWVPRFIQIMEEVLTEILQKDSSFLNFLMPPPWTLHEATECIKKKFSIDPDVVDAANKLTNTLYINSNKSGKINTNLEPESFMKIYSYGVYLIDSLQSLLHNCEDLQIASDSLAKLLNDIQDPSTYNIHNESFNNNMEDPSAEVTMTSSTVSTIKESIYEFINNTNQEEPNEASHQRTKPNNDKGQINATGHKGKAADSRDDSTTQIVNSSKRNLRGSSKKIESETAEKNVKFIRNIDMESNFFTTLNLKRNVRLFNKDVDSSKANSSELEKVDNTPSKCVNENKENAVEPKIIRNFSMTLEFENRLKNKNSNGHEGEDLDIFNHEVDQRKVDYYDEEEKYDYFDEEEKYDLNQDYFLTDEQICETKEFEQGKDQDKEQSAVIINSKAANDFHWIAGKVITEIKQVFTLVYTFCDNCRDELESSKSLTLPRKKQILKKAQSLKMQMDNLNTSLTSIIYRKEVKGNIQTILKDVGVSMDSKVSVEYEVTIAKCLKKAEDLQELVDLVVEAVNESCLIK